MKALCVVWAVGLAVLAGCIDSEHSSPEAVNTPGPVQLNFELADPAFEAAPDAEVRFGRLGGTNYVLEMPDDWNGDLVVYMRGSHLSNTLRAQGPELRSYLLRHGFAWAASSYSHAFAPERAADESAAVFDAFVREFELPERTYALGVSLGGGAALISAERYSDRYDGALALCPVPPAHRPNESWEDYTVAALLLAGVQSLDPDTDHSAIEDTVQRVLADPSSAAALEDLWIRLTGGERPLARTGYELERPEYLPHFYLDADNESRRYKLAEPGDQAAPGSAGAMSEDDFNARVLRHRGQYAGGDPVNSFSGKIQIPTIAVAVTGDTTVPLSDAQAIQRAVDRAGSEDLFVHRAIRSPQHCRITSAEQEAQFEDLVGWVRDGDRPTGEDLVDFVPESLGRNFTFLDRPDLEAGQGLTVLRGTVTIDGRPISSTPFLRLISQQLDGLLSVCQAYFSGVRDGRFTEALADAQEVVGCDRPAKVFVETLNLCESGSTSSTFSLNAVELVPGPAEYDVEFSIDCEDPKGVARPFTVVAGVVLDSAGDLVWDSILIEAYIDGTLCGQTSFGGVGRSISDQYLLLVSGPELKAGCSPGAEIDIRVNGESAGAATNKVDELDGGEAQWVELVVDD